MYSTIIAICKLLQLSIPAIHSISRWDALDMIYSLHLHDHCANALQSQLDTPKRYEYNAIVNSFATKTQAKHFPPGIFANVQVAFIKSI